MTCRLFGCFRVFQGAKEDTPIPGDSGIARKILVIDDEPGIAQSLADALAAEGHQVRAITNGRQAIRLIEQFAPDLVITDIMMPQADMLDLISALRWVGPPLKIIAISANPHLLRLAARDGADHVLSKPFRIGELNALVKKLLGSR